LLSSGTTRGDGNETRRNQNYRNRVIDSYFSVMMKAKNILLSEALEAMTNLAPRVKDHGGCFGRMAGGIGGYDCSCTACKIKRELA
jgi:hypothetical protein